jgi:hypothetical protein
MGLAQRKNGNRKGAKGRKEKRKREESRHREKV